MYWLIKYKKILIPIFFLILIILGYLFLIKIIKDGIRQGPDYSDMRKKITMEILDSCSAGLKRYYQLHGDFPKYGGKYFLDSIKTLVSINDAYIYPDSANGDNFIRIKLKIKRDSLLKSHNLFIGIGRPEQYIKYKYLTNNSFMLYSVGENGIDENGSGDDIMIKRSL